MTDATPATEIDLSAANEDALRGVFHDYTGQARRIGNGRSPARNRQALIRLGRRYQRG